MHGYEGVAVATKEPASLSTGKSLETEELEMIDCWFIFLKKKGSIWNLIINI